MAAPTSISWGGAESLADTLAVGNTTGGNDIVVSSGQIITAETYLSLVAGDAEVAMLTGGFSTGATAGGDVFLYGGDASGTGDGGDVEIDGGSSSGGTAGTILIGNDSTYTSAIYIGALSGEGTVANLEIENGGDVILQTFSDLFLSASNTLGASCTTFNLSGNGLTDSYAFTIGSNGEGSVTIGDGAAGTVFTVNMETVNIPQINSPNGVQIGASEDPMSGLILVKKGYMSLGEGSVAYGIEFGPVYYDTKNGTYVQFGPNSIYVDGDNNVIRSTDGNDVRNVFPFSDAEGGETYDLTGAGAIDASPLEPGSVTVRIILESDPTQFSEVTDDGAGAFAAGDVLPAGGTVNYASRTLTGVTAALAAGSRVEIAYKIANGAGGQITLRAGDGEGTAAGGDLTIRSGAGGATSGNSGNVLIDVGEVTVGTPGSITVGPTDAEVIDIGNDASTTTVIGTFYASSEILARRRVVVLPGGATALTSDDTFTQYVNTGVGALSEVTLPELTSADDVGIEFEFYVDDANGIRVIANTGDTITLLTLTSPAAGNVESTTAGSWIRLVSISATQWVAMGSLGSWTVSS